MFRATIGTTAVFIYATPEQPKEILNGAGADCYYKATQDVDSGDTKLEAGKTVQITDSKWFVSVSSTELVVRDLTAGSFEDASVVDDFTVGDDLAVGGDATVTGAANIGGDLNHDGTKVGFFGTAPAAQPDLKPAAEVTAKELGEALVTLGLIK
ncbi:MAG TPA: hypothetical protein VN752_05300 [Solirubrobacterales bacterium]|nr:hypothetical protein [Solirubrobacterales bacterium]